MNKQDLQTLKPVLEAMAQAAADLVNDQPLNEPSPSGDGSVRKSKRREIAARVHWALAEASSNLDALLERMPDDPAPTTDAGDEALHDQVLDDQAVVDEDQVDAGAEVPDEVPSP